ncbi:SDR family NAD(P)-dependent oxidoreductase [Amycolatopsis thermoflava]|uniref:SDR family NAD(P)-dependent oxidoreductase n=1 Tax=Amycolatopsis thermoflava TaxID=84480 RepID=UPI0037FDEAFB
MSFDDSAVPAYPSLARLDGKVFAVLGAGQGIGRQTAHALAQAGGRVVCVGRRPEPTNRVAEEVGGRAFVGDAQKRTELEKLFSFTKDELGRVDGVVDVIGQGLNGSTQSVTDTEWEWQYDNVIKHALLAVQIGTPYLKESGGGTFTFVSSSMGRYIYEGLHTVAYSTAKAALNHLTRVAAVELGPSNIRVNTVSPALTRTPRLAEIQDDEWFAGAARNYPLRRTADPADIASVILFLASEQSRHVTGQVIDVDGGLGLLTPSPFPMNGFSGASIREDGTVSPT